jgi:hypothetical protein
LKWIQLVHDAGSRGKRVLSRLEIAVELVLQDEMRILDVLSAVGDLLVLGEILALQLSLDFELEGFNQ